MTDRSDDPVKTLPPCVLWLTGLSGAGKTTVAKGVYKEICRRRNRVELLDGDNIRDLFPRTGFSKADRDMHIRRVGYLASLLERNDVFIVAAFISPYEETRRFVRSLCRNFIEVYISTPLEVCEKRDPKGLYAKARRGEIKGFTGIDDPYEPPVRPEIDLNTAVIDQAAAVRTVIDYLTRA